MFNNGMIWVVLSVFFSANLAAGENPFFSFTSADVSKKLSQKTVRQIYQDSTGYLWVVTQEGLSRYDGYQLLKFIHDPSAPSSISSDNVRAVIEDKNKRLWIATDGAGLNLFEPSSHTFTKWRENSNIKHTVLSDQIRSMYLQDNGYIWLGYNNGSFSRLNPNDMTFEHFNTRKLIPDLQRDAFITSIVEDEQNILFATDGNGLLKLNKSNHQLTRLYTGSESPLFSDRLTQVFIDAQRRLWLTSYDAGVSVLKAGSDKFTTWEHHENQADSVAANLVHTIYQDHKKRIWLGTEAGVSLWNSRDSFTSFDIKNGLSDNKVLSILQDTSGLMWLGTYNGVTKSIEVPFEQINKGLASNIVLGFAETESSSGEHAIWVASYGGLTRLNSHAEIQQIINKKSEPALTDARVMTVHADRNILWFGTRDGGLGRLNVDTQKIKYFVHDSQNPKSLSFNGVTSVLADTSGNLWVGTFGGGLNFLAAGSSDFIRYRYQNNNPRSLNHDRVVAVTQLDDGTIMVGTALGINIFNPRTLDFDHIEHVPDHLDSLSVPMAWAFYQAPDKQLWVGTQGGGLNQWSAKDIHALNNHFTRYNGLNGLPSSHIYSIQADEKNNLWLSSTAGLTRFNPTSGGIRHFDTSQGLKGSEFNFGAGFKDSRGYLYFGGNAGFVRFHPSNIKDSKLRPPAVLVRIKKINEKFGTDLSYQKQQEIVLDYQDYFISFEFAALDFNAPELSEYRYMLEGLDPEWVDLGHSRLASFTNLPSGRYELKVQARNNQGLWNAEGVALPLTVLPPPWKTFWAYTLYALLLMLMVLNIFWHYRQKRSHETQQRIKLEKKVEERTTDLIRANEKLEQISFTDPLTGLKNRRYLAKNLSKDVDLVLSKYQSASDTVTSMTAKDTDLIFFLMDLDHFKHINDKYGHGAGDAVLIHVKSILESVFRDTEYLLRWGGEEFLVVARFVDRENAARLAERLRSVVQEYEFKIDQGNVLNITCSIGFSVFPLLSDQPTALNWERTIDIADLCLYAAKKSGRNAWVGLLDSTCNEEDTFLAIVEKTEQLIQLGQLRLASSITDTDKILWR